MSAASDTPDSTNLSHEGAPAYFRCGECGGPLLWRTLPTESRGAEPDRCWETPPQMPPGATRRADAGGWVCFRAECRRVYLVWEGIPTFLRQEAGVLTVPAHAELREGNAAG